jgi:hypothetical protein
MAFYINKNHPVKLFINSYIIINIAYFREAIPNYTRLSINKSNKESLSSNGWYISERDDNS